jgi:hypothetical protein
MLGEQADLYLSDLASPWRRFPHGSALLRLRKTEKSFADLT